MSDDIIKLLKCQFALNWVFSEDLEEENSTDLVFDVGGVTEMYVASLTFIEIYVALSEKIKVKRNWSAKNKYFAPDQMTETLHKDTFEQCLSLFLLHPLIL